MVGAPRVAPAGCPPNQVPFARSLVRLRAYIVLPIYLAQWVLPMLLVLSARDAGAPVALVLGASSVLIPVLGALTVVLHHGLRDHVAVPVTACRRRAAVWASCASVVGASAYVALIAVGAGWSGAAWVAGFVNAGAIAVAVGFSAVASGNSILPIALGIGLGGVVASGDTRIGLVAGAWGFGALALVQLSLWQVDVMRRLEAARRAESALAVAEERLRFSRDLHDLAGRALAAVSMHAQVGRKRIQRGDPDAAAGEMLVVTRLAHDATTQMRELVDGYRALDFSEELTSARELLRSAGITVDIAGSPETPPPAVREQMAWVVREAVTNILRHSHASEVSIEMRAASIRISNNGAPVDGARNAAGRGLAGLRERLATAGWNLSTCSDGGRFAVRAEMTCADARKVEER